MPIQLCEINGKPGFKYGKQGKCYTYNPKNETSKKNAKKRAIRQGLAEHGGKWVDANLINDPDVIEETDNYNNLSVADKTIFKLKYGNSKNG